MTLATDIIRLAHGVAASRPRAFPGYIASRIALAFRRGTIDPENVVASVTIEGNDGDFFTVDLTDFNGTKYRVSVEVMP